MFQNMDLFISDFEICHIGMKIEVKIVVWGLFCFSNQVYIEILVSLIGLPLYTLIVKGYMVSEEVRVTGACLGPRPMFWCAVKRHENALTYFIQSI